METIPIVVISLLIVFSYSLVYQAWLLLADYGLIISGDKENPNTALSFGLNTLTIVFVFILAVVVLIYCLFVLFTFISKTRAVTLLGCICSIFTLVIVIVLIVMMCMTLSTSKTEFKTLFESNNLEKDQQSYKEQLEQHYACCGYDSSSEISYYSCNSQSSAIIYCGEQIYESFTRIMYDLFVPLVSTGCCCLFMTFVSAVIFFNQKKEFNASNEWGDEIYQ